MKEGLSQPLKIVNLAQIPLCCANLACIFFVEVTYSLCYIIIMLTDVVIHSISIVYDALFAITIRQFLP